MSIKYIKKLENFSYFFENFGKNFPKEERETKAKKRLIPLKLEKLEDRIKEKAKEKL